MSKVNRNKKEVNSTSKKSGTVATTMKIRRCVVRLRRCEISSVKPSVPSKENAKAKTENLNEKTSKKVRSTAVLAEKTAKGNRRILSNKPINRIDINIKANGDKCLTKSTGNATKTKEPKKNTINEIDTQKKYKIRKCVVRVKRLKKFEVFNLTTSNPTTMKPLQEKNISQKPSNMERFQEKTTSLKPFQEKTSVKDCFVKLKKIKDKASQPNLNNSILKRSSVRASKQKVVEKNVSFSSISSNVSFEEDMIITEFQATKSTSPRNLANRPNDITELLLLNDDNLLKSPTDIEQQSEVFDNPKTIENEKSENTNKTIIKNKFFHKNEKNLIEENRENTKPTIKKSNIVSKNRKTSKAQQKVSIAKNDVYEFLSQSQNSDSDAAKNKDVAADIIKRLIQQGKVAVAKNRKGKPCIIHKRTRVRKIKLQTKKEETKNKNEKNKVTLVTQTNDDNDVNFFDFDEPREPAEIPVITSDTTNLPQQYILKDNMHKNKDAAATTDATFSSLARSVLVRETENQEAARKKKLTLERHNSTPFKPQQSTSQPQIEAEFSPIRQLITQKLNSLEESKKKQLSLQEEQPTFSGNAKSTRKTLDRPPLENYMSFSLKSPGQEQPTFSGNARSLTRRTHARPSTFNNLSFSLLSPAPSTSNQQQQSQKNSLSSFSSNDSNAENQPPPPKRSSASLQAQSSTGIENDVIHSARQTPNPRRTLTIRSPLKAINIIDVVTLPPYTGPFSKQSIENVKDKTKNDSKLFGFEEYLDTNETIQNETLQNESSISENSSLSKTSKANLSKHLKKLKQWRPKLNPLKRDAGNNTTIASNFFEDDFYAKTKRNRNIKDMLCSTMINNKNKTSKEDSTNISNTLAAESIDVHDDSDDSDVERSNEKAEAELFGDPETSFDHRQAHRTYQRPFKRKRKLIHQFSEIFESDEEHSDEDENSHNKSIFEKKQRKTKKRQCRAKSPVNHELEEFYDKFNSQLKEAEDYELIVE